MPYNSNRVTFVETPLFTRLIHDYLTDDEYAELQEFIGMYPEAGDLVPGTGGVRKLRWKTMSRGKRSGLRIIYYRRTQVGQIWLLTLYSKTSQENIPAHVLRAIREEIEND